MQQVAWELLLNISLAKAIAKNLLIGLLLSLMLKILSLKNRERKTPRIGSRMFRIFAYR